MKPPALVTPGQAAASGPDGVDVHHGDAERIAADTALARDEGLALLDECHVAAGSADVHGDDAVETGPGGRVAASDDAGGRARKEHADRPLGGHVGGRQRAARLHDLQLGLDPRPGQRLLKLLEVRGDDGPHVGVEGREAGALVLAEDRVHFRGQRDAELREALAEDLFRAPLVRRVQEGKEVADGDGLDPVAPPQTGDGLHQLGLIEGDEHGAVRVDPLADADPETAGGEERGRLAVREEVVHLTPLLASDLEDVLEPLRHEQSHCRALLLQDGVGRDGGAVGEPLDIGRAGPGDPEDAVDARENPIHEPPRRRGHLGEKELPPVLEADDVGEGSTHVDTDPDHATPGSLRGQAGLGRAVGLRARRVEG
jgi:hypothetical protein